MTPADAAFVLGPIWQGFASARCRLAQLREHAEPVEGMSLSAVARHVVDVEDAVAYLEAVQNRFLCSETGALMTVIEGRGSCAWPNIYPDPGARRRAEVFYFAKRFEVELNRPAEARPLRRQA